MLFVFVPFVSFLLLAPKFHPLPSWAIEMRLLLLLFIQEFLFTFFQFFKISSLTLASSILTIPSKMSAITNPIPKLKNVELEEAMTVLDLPELVLESILGRLSPAGLCKLGSVCNSMRERCRSDHLWERHMREKWCEVIGDAAVQQWQLYVSSTKDSIGKGNKMKGLIGALSFLWPLSWFLSSKLDIGSNSRNSLPVDSIMSWYLELESGRFWFPAQVYNRENGHVGFTLSCYDAELSYEHNTDSFRARYPSHGRRSEVLEDHVQWQRLRVPPVETPANSLHVSDCLNDLHPGDNIEIQWRRNKQFPYAKCVMELKKISLTIDRGVVGHVESCDGNEILCCCHHNETVVLEFRQHAPGSRWRQASVNRKNHREEGNETDGFYGGIRKLWDEKEISKWKQFWPTKSSE